MNPREIVDILKPDAFEPCVFITNNGDRYEVRHSEMARVIGNGTVYVFEPADREDAHYERCIRLGSQNIAAIEPLRKQSA